MNSEKKATVRDIAKKAGVSVATVSYVLNDKDGIKISEATRKKVLQVANLLNYSIPEKYKNNSEHKNHYLVGIAYCLNPSTPSRNAEIMHVISLLAERFSRMHFGCMLIPIDPGTNRHEPIQGLDGIIAVDLSEEDFKQMSGNYYIPIVCLDMIINDFLFYQIYTDIEKIINTAADKFGNDFYLIIDEYCNKEYQNYLLSSVPGERAIIYSMLEDKSALKGKKLLAFGHYLGLELQKTLPSCETMTITDLAFLDDKSVIHHDLEKKANLAMNIMMNAFEKKFDVKHEYKI